MLRARLAERPDNGPAWQQWGGLLLEAGRAPEAAEAFARAQQAGQPVTAFASPFALALSAAGRHAEAVALLEPVQARKPKDFALANLLGVLLKRAGRLDAAVAALEQARRLQPRNVSPWQNLGNVHDLRGDYAEAAAAFAGGTRLDPRNAELWRLRGRAERAQGRREEAAASLERAASLNPRERDPAALLVATLLDLGRTQDALAAVARLRAALGGDPAAEVLEARILLRLGRVEDAKARLDATLAARPGDMQANLLLAAIAGDGDRRAANDALQRAAAANPDAPEPIENLIDSLARSRYDDEAAHLEEAYRLAVRLLAKHPDRVRPAARSLRTVFQRVLDLDRLAETGTLPELLPVWLAQGRHAAVHYELGQVASMEDRLRIVEWHRAWGRRATAGIRAVARPAAPTPLAAPAVAFARKLRVGFMSSDLRNHPVTYFALPLLEGYDRDAVQVFCYSFYEGQRDRVQEVIEGRVDAFRWWPRTPDDQVAEGIAEDDLDILFELGGSTAMNKLEVMARKPARLGASWLGYPHSAGLEQIDLILVDPYIKPEDPRLLIERPFEMPESWVCLSRLGFHEEPILDGIPEERRGALTFGTANNPYKFTPACLDAWAAVLRAVPDSRFLFVRPEAAGVSFVANAKREFARRDVDPARLDFVGIRGKHLPHYNSIDIALDSLPHVGGTTTCEALWMGVPTITLVGPGFPERLAYSNLANSGLPDLAAFSVAEYVAKAAALAADRARRRLLRHGLRDMIRAHPLGQPSRFVKNFYETAARVAAE
jgi:predicted O-linked N-acetylglucosamine transferase (SPINDLY family)